MSLIKFVPTGVQAQMGIGAYFGESIGFGMLDQWMKKINQFKVDTSFFFTQKYMPKYFLSCFLNLCNFLKLWPLFKCESLNSKLNYIMS